MIELSDPARSILVGVDIGGSKVAVIVVDAKRRVRSRLVVAADANGEGLTVGSIVGSIRAALESAGASNDEVAGIGIGVPGRVDSATGIVRLAVNLHWHEEAIGPEVYAAFGVPVFVENDARAAAAGLSWAGDGNGHQIESMAYVSVGTGIAAGLILDGRLYRGARGMAGEIGHTVVEVDGPVCSCGLRGCLEAVAAGPAIARRAQEVVASGRPTLLARYRPLTAAGVYQAAAAGDAEALAIAETAGRHLARAVLNLVMAYDVDRVVIGGGVSRAGDAFLGPIRRELERQRRASELASEMVELDTIDLLPPESDAGAWGAIALVEQGLRMPRPRVATGEVSDA